VGCDHLTSASASEQNPSSLEYPPELPVVLTTRIVPALKPSFNSAHKPLLQQFFIRPSHVSLHRTVLKWLQTIDVLILCRVFALFSMIREASLSLRKK
jgi:hypothetical protein